MPSMNAKPGEIWLANLGLAAKTRPVLIISRQDPEAPRVLLLNETMTKVKDAIRFALEL